MTTIDDLVDQWEAMREQGHEPSLEQLCKDHPHLLKEVSEQIQRLKAFDSHFCIVPIGSEEPQKSSELDFQPPHSISFTSRYRLDHYLASGGLGQVYIAWDEVLKRKVAIKFPRRMNMSSMECLRFEQEACITGRLDHPGIVPIYALDTAIAGEPCYVMRYVEGQTLQDAVRASLPELLQSNAVAYSESVVLRHHLQAFIAVCQTVAYAHQQGVCHRDIKPNNILLGTFGEVILLDWGIAKQWDIPTGQDSVDDQLDALTTNRHLPRAVSKPSISPDLTLPGQAYGTPAYASPEQILSTQEVGAPTDLFSLGATLFYILSGTTPMESLGWQAYLRDLKSGQIRLESVFPAPVPAGLRAICSKALQVDPKDRYANASDLATDIDRLLAREPISVLKDSWVTVGLRKARRHPALVSALLSTFIVLLVSAFAASVLLGHKNRELTQSNIQLDSALKNVSATNEVAMRALRSMMDEVISHGMAQQNSLTDAEKNYIQSILDQYQQLASIQDDSKQSLAIRAEALGQLGQLYYHLDQRPESIAHLERCVTLYEQLLGYRSNQEDRYLLRGFLEMLATAQFEKNDYEAAIASASRSIELYNSAAVQTLSNAEIGTLADLHVVRAGCMQSIGKPTEALGDFRTATRMLESAIQSDASDTSLQFALGSNLRSYASLLLETATDRAGLINALELAERAVQQSQAAALSKPDIYRYRSSLAWALHDRSYIHEALEDLEKALADASAALSITQQLTQQFPLLRSYADRVPGALMRKAHIHIEREQWTRAHEDLSSASEFDLQPAQLRRLSELFTRLMRNAPGNWTQRANSMSKLAWTHSRQAQSLSVSKQFSQAAKSFLEATQLLDLLLANTIPANTSSTNKSASRNADEPATTKESRQERAKIVALISEFVRATPEEISNQDARTKQDYATLRKWLDEQTTLGE